MLVAALLFFAAAAAAAADVLVPRRERLEAGSITECALIILTPWFAATATPTGPGINAILVVLDEVEDEEEEVEEEPEVECTSRTRRRLLLLEWLDCCDRRLLSRLERSCCNGKGEGEGVGR